MTLWFDVTDLHHWRIGHLTGIPRTGVGIHNGLVALGHEVRLFRYRKDDQRVVTVTADDLPETVCVALGGIPRATVSAEPVPTTTSMEGSSTQARPAAASPAKAEPARLFKRLIKTTGRLIPGYIRRHPASREFLSSVAECARSGARLCRAVVSPSYTRVLPPEAHQSSPIAHAVATVSRPDNHPDLPVREGDVVFAIVSTGLPSSVVEALQQRGARIVRLIYDMIPALKPQWVKPRDTEIFTAWARDVMRHSDLLLAISRFTASEAIRFCKERGLSSPRIEPVRLADVLELAHAGNSHQPPAFVPARPFFLCVCTLDIRKNHRLLYDTWTKLLTDHPEDSPDLLLIGTEHYFMSDFIRELEHDPLVKHRIHWLKNVSDADLGWYYRHCLATIYPSKYEGWGLPVAESLAHGKICLSSNTSSMPEISELPLFFSPWSRDELYELVRRVWRDEASRGALEERIRSSFRTTTWLDTAGEIMTALQKQATENFALPSSRHTTAMTESP